MEATVDLKELINEGIRDLPTTYLSEVADFVVFMRRKALEQQPYDLTAISQELSLLDAQERQHLDDEFADFDPQFPKE